MYKVEDSFETSLLLWLLFILIVIFVVSYYWRRRYLYYCASKIPGPFSLPLIGIAHRFCLTPENFFEIFWNIIKKNPKVFKFWFGPYLYVSTTRPQDIDIILSTFLEKGNSYQFFFERITNSLVAAPVNIWKKNRKYINHSFKLATINSFHDIFVKHSRHLVKTLEKTCGENETDLLTKVWICTLDAAFESLCDMDSANAGLSKIIPWAVSAQQAMIKRMHSIWLHLDSIWKLSAVGRRAKIDSSELNKFFTEILEMKRKTLNNVDLKNSKNINRKFCFLNYLVDRLLRNGHINSDQIVEETIFMMPAASETSAITTTSVMLLLGMYPHIQDKVYQEITSVTDDNIDIFLQDVRRFEYVQRVIKETMRVLPIVPLLMRHIDRDVHLDSFTIPSGCDVLIPIIELHRDPDLWPDPLKFDPDRFLPEEIEKRHRCAYIPFSFGSRDCIGKLYALNQIKCLVVHIVKNFKIKTLNWKSIDDIEFDYHVTSKPKDYKLVIKKRKQD